MTAKREYGLSRRQAMAGITGAVLLAPAGLARAAEAGASADAVAEVKEELVTANHILADHEIVDAFGHISRRHPGRSDRFFLSRARAPGLIAADDFMEFDLAGNPVDAQGRSPYLERFIHAAIYAARPDVNSVVHDHSPGIVPFSVSSQPLRPVSNAGGALGTGVPVWDIAEKFGDSTNLLVANLEIGRDLAKRLGSGAAVLMRGHGVVLAASSVRLATFLAISIESQARLQMQAQQLGGVKYLSPGETRMTAKILDPATPGDAIGRAWEYWCKKTNRPFKQKGY